MKSNIKIALNKREDKKQINIKWNSRLFFQIGLIISLLAVFLVMETSVERKAAAVVYKTPEGIKEPPMVTYIIDIEKPKLVLPKRKNTNINPEPPKILKSNKFEVYNNDTVVQEDNVPSNNIAPTSNVVMAETPLEPSINKPSSIANVEFVPVFPGCEKLRSNQEKIVCMSAKINSFINRNFRKELLEGFDSNDIQKIYVQFKIDTNGLVTDVLANAHNSVLKKEVQRVINKLPTMKPGKQGNKEVEVLYTVPIVFRIQ